MAVPFIWENYLHGQPFAIVVLQQPNRNPNLNPFGWTLYIELDNLPNQVIPGYDPLKKFAQ